MPDASSVQEPQKGNDIGKIAKTDLTGTYLLDDDVMDEMENLEATATIENFDDLPQDSEPTVVLGETCRLKSRAAKTPNSIQVALLNGPLSRAGRPR